MGVSVKALVISIFQPRSVSSQHVVRLTYSTLYVSHVDKAGGGEGEEATANNVKCYGSQTAKELIMSGNEESNDTL